MSDPVLALNENFFFNCMLAKALIQLIPANDREVMRRWLEKLTTLDQDAKELEIRNEYMWFILLMLQSKKIREPFNKVPPAEIPPLRDVVPLKVYEEVLIENDDNMTWMDKSDADTSVKKKKKKDPAENFAPSKFFHNQPLPYEGVICYLAAFSDQGY